MNTFFLFFSDLFFVIHTCFWRMLLYISYLLKFKHTYNIHITYIQHTYNLHLTDWCLLLPNRGHPLSEGGHLLKKGGHLFLNSRPLLLEFSREFKDCLGLELLLVVYVIQYVG